MIKCRNYTYYIVYIVTSSSIICSSTTIKIKQKGLRKDGKKCKTSRVEIHSEIWLSYGTHEKLNGHK